MSKTTIQVRVYYEDTDFSGIVYHANYLKFFERGRSEALRELGITHSDLLELEEPIAFSVRRMNIEFIKPATIDDLLDVRTHFTSAKGARLLVEQALWRGEECLAKAEVEVACVSLDGRPKRLPKMLQDKLAEK